MRTYPSFIAGLRYRDPERGSLRSTYARYEVRVGDILIPQREPYNPYDENAVALRHNGFHIGYVPQRHDWVAASLDEGDTLLVKVTEIKISGWWVFRRVVAIFLTISVAGEA